MDEETKKKLRANAGIFFLAHLTDLQIASIAAAFFMFDQEFTRCFKKVVENEDAQCWGDTLGGLAQLIMTEAREWAKHTDKERWEDKEND